MKKTLLFVASLAIGSLGYAQVLPTEYADAPIPQGLNDTVNKFYVVKNTKETKVSKYTVDFNLTKINNYSAIYTPSVLSNGLSVAFDRTQVSDFPNYNELFLYWATWGKNRTINPPANPFSYILSGDEYIANQSQDTLIGTFIDLIANPFVTIVAKSTAKTNVTLLLIDKNGRSSNLVCPKRWLNGGTEWETLEFRFDQKKLDGSPDWEFYGTENNDNVGIAADGWSGSWWDVPAGRGYISNGYPCNERTNYAGAVMLDLHNIVGIGFRFDDGSITKDYSLETKKTIEIQSIVLGGEPKNGGAPVPAGLNDTINKYYTVTNTIGSKVQGVELVSKSTDVHWYENSAQYKISDNNLAKDIEFNLGNKPNYSPFSVYCVNWGVKKNRTPQGKKPFSYELDAAAWANKKIQFNAIPQIQQDTLIGSFVNFKENPVVTMVVEATERTNVWLNIIDKNGRVSNFISAAHWIEKGSTQTIEFRYDQEKLDGTPDWLYGYTVKRTNNNVGIAADAWSNNWWEVNTGRYPSGPVLFERTDKNGAVLLDLENIVGVEVLFDAENFNSDFSLATNKTIRIKSLIIGKAVLSAPDAIIGDASICLGTTKTYKWNRVKDATEYNLIYSGTGATIVVTDTSATVELASNATAGTLELTAQAGAIVSAKTIKLIEIKAKPSAPSITGNTSFCQTAKTAEFSIQAISSDETVSWSTEKNMSFSSGQGTIAVKTIFADTITQGFIAVEVSNVCGMLSDKENLTIKKLPVLTASIVGKDTVCKNTKQELYSLSVNSTAEYIWTLGGKTLTAQKDTAKIDFATDNVTISVTAKNECGVSSEANKSVIVQSAYPEPIGLVTFSKDGKAMQVAWEHTKGVGTKQYKLYRETTSLGIWEPVSIVPYEKAGLYTDEDVAIDEKRYRYKLRTYSTCGDSAESTPHRNMLLQTSYNVGTKKVNLIWGAYEGISVPTYIVYRVYADGRADEEVVRVAGNETMAYDPSPIANTSYRIAFKLLQEVDPLFYHFKSDNGPFSQSLSNMAEANLVDVENGISNSLEISPNPASSYVTISGLSTKEAQLTLINNCGQAIDCQSKILNESSIEIQTSELTSGLYTIVITQNKVITTQKLQISK